MVSREDIWACETCLVCQLKYNTEVERIRHENEILHKKKVQIYDFFLKELSVITPSSDESILFERYARANTSIAGLDCICELNFVWSKIPLWVCTVCFVAGKNLDSADSHLYSSFHKRNYINIHHLDIYNKMCIEKEKVALNEHLNIEHNIVQNFLFEAKCLSPPDVYILEDKDPNYAYKKLALDDVVDPTLYILEPISDIHQIVQCLTCGESFFAYEKPELFQKTWNVHLSSNYHQKCQMILTLLEEEYLEEKIGLPSYCKLNEEICFKFKKNNYYGPTGGFNFLIDFKDDDKFFCTICFCFALKEEANNHFSCEYHLERFARRFNPSKLLNNEYFGIEERHKIIIESLKHNNHSTKHRVYNGVIPSLIKRFSFKEQRKSFVANIQKVKIGDKSVVWCENCTQYILIENADSWQEHIFEEEHFDFCTKRVMYYIDKEGVVSNSTKLPLFRKANKGWEEKYFSKLGRNITVQDHCYYGLQYIVRDELGRVNICTCCHYISAFDDDDLISIHVRSIEHLTRLMHLVNKKFLALLWKTNDLQQQKDLMLDYLKHCKIDRRVDKPLVYDPVSALNANCLVSISACFLEIAKCSPETRASSIKSLQSSVFKKEKVPLNLALRSTNIEIKLIEKLIVMFCQKCNQSFACCLKSVSSRFIEHLFSTSHWNRQLLLYDNRLDENKRVVGQFSSFEIPSFSNHEKQKCWKWNEKRKTYEFLYGPFGLSNICERRNFKFKKDFFCNLCAESFKATKYDLETHVRSFTHIFYYVHYYCPFLISDLEALLLENIENNLKHKRICNFFASSLKNMKKENEEIAIYDYFSINFCDLPKVKESIELQGKDEKKPITFLKQEREKERSYFGESTSIYANNKHEKKSPEHLHQCFINLLSINDVAKLKKKPNLEIATQSILTTLYKKNKISSTSEESIKDKEKESNLENDENDIIYISTNFGSKSSSVSTLEPEKLNKQNGKTSRSKSRNDKVDSVNSNENLSKKVFQKRSRSSKSRSYSRSRSRSKSKIISNNEANTNENVLKKTKVPSVSKSKKSKESNEDITLRTLKIKKALDNFSKKSNDSYSFVEHENNKIRKSRWNINNVQNSDTRQNQNVEFLKNELSAQKNLFSFLDKTRFDLTNSTDQFSKFSFSTNSGAKVLPNSSLEQKSFVFNPPSDINFFEFIGHSTNPYGPGPTFPNLSQSLNFSTPIPSFIPTNVNNSSVDSLDVVYRAKKDLYEHDLINIKTIPQFLVYLLNQGFDEIPLSDQPLFFNEIVQKRKGVLGCNMLYQVICYGHQELETYYCGICNYWTTVSEIFSHLCTSTHRLNYMFRNYKAYHKKIISEPDEDICNILLNTYAEQIWKIEGSGKCLYRMRCVLNEEAIRRIWPEYANFVDNSWKIMDIDISELTAAAASSSKKKSEALNNNTSSKSNKNQTPLSDFKLNYKFEVKDNQKQHDSFFDRREREKFSNLRKKRATSRSRSKSPFLSHRHSSRSPNRSYREERKHKDYNRERRRSRSLKRRFCRSRSPTKSGVVETLKKNDSWDAKAAAFLDRIGNYDNSLKLPSPKLHIPEKINIEKSPVKNSINDRLKSVSSVIKNKTTDDLSIQNFLNKLSKSDENTSSNKRCQNLKVTKTTHIDEKADMRKIIGIIVELQSIFEKEKVISSDTFFKVCEDMGISAENAVKNILLNETATMYRIDLNAEYETYFRKKTIVELIQSSQLIGLSSEVMNILKKVNFNSINEPSTSSALQNESEFECRRRPYEPELNEDINYIYPFYENENDTNKYHRDPKEIESTINKLTYAFSSNKNFSPKQQKNLNFNNLKHCGQLFQRFSDEDENEDDVNNQFQNKKKHFNSNFEPILNVRRFGSNSSHKSFETSAYNAVNDAYLNLENCTKSSSTNSNINNLINMASQVGDDWGSLNNYVTNFLKKSTGKET